MKRQALNKFNAPEMLGALFKALQAAGLEDTVDDLRKLKVPQIINQAWQKRKKLGNEEVVTMSAPVCQRSRMSVKVASRWLRKQT